MNNKYLQDKLKADDFLISDHESLSEDLNRVSDDLLKAKWYFLATIAALGVAYRYIYEKNSATSNFPWPLIVIFIIGDIVFWLISEYALSHGFLFRFIQAKLAKIEDYFNKRTIEKQKFSKLTKDPTDMKNFIIIKNNGDKEGWLFFDFVIPDQFVPIYWASFWAIIINSIAAYSIYNLLYQCYNYQFILGIVVFISSMFIWKLWNYHIYKINQFIKNYCDFRFIASINGEEIDFFSFPFLIRNIRCRIAITIIAILACSIQIFFLKPMFPLLILAATIVLFWPVAVGIIIHIIRNLFRIISWDEWRLYAPSVGKPDMQRTREVTLKTDHAFLKKIYWTCWLLFFTV